MNFDDLLGDQPDVPDWPGLVRQEVVFVRRRRRIAFTLAATSLVVLGTVGAIYATSPSPAPSVVAEEPTQTDSPVPTGPPLGTPSPTPSPTASPSESATPDPSSTPPSQPTPTATIPTYYTGESQTITISDVHFSPQSPVDGSDVEVTFHASWSASRPFAGGRCDDCTTQVNTAGPLCPAPMFPSPPAKQPGEADFSVRVAMSGAGLRHVTVTAATSCGYYQGNDAFTFPVQVQPDPSSTTTATTSPVPSVSPS